MKRTETNKPRPAERFSILVVPRNRSNIKRLEISGRMLKIAAGAGLLGALAVMIAVSSMFYYRSAYLATEDVRVQAAEFTREKAALAMRVAEIEASLDRTERFAAKVASTFKTDSANVGTGPIDEEGWDSAQNLSIPTVASIDKNLTFWKAPFSKHFTKGLNLSLDKLSERSGAVEEKVHTVFGQHQDKLFFWASLPSIWPANGWVTSEFSASRSWGGHRRLHEGIDIAAPVGTTVVAPGDGIVTYTGYQAGYGREILIDHGYGLATRYAHCSSILVDEGQHVKRGDIIAGIGNTGRSTGPHLHYEVRVDGVPVDPRFYIMNAM